MMKPTISAIIIAKNEEARLATCLQALGWVDELIVVDNGSTDTTVQIAKQHGAAVYEADQKDFASVRELGLAKATKTWILYIDADEVVTDVLHAEIERAIQNTTIDRPNTYFILRDTYFLGYHWPYRDKVERLFLRKAIKGWSGRLHETPVYEGSSATLIHPLVHRTHRTLEEMLDKTNDWSDVEAELRFEAHHPPVTWWRFLRVMVTGFLRSYIDERGWRAGTVGFIESIYQGFSMFITYAKLWELQQQKKSGR